MGDLPRGRQRPRWTGSKSSGVATPTRGHQPCPRYSAKSSLTRLCLSGGTLACCRRRTGVPSTRALIFCDLLWADREAASLAASVRYCSLMKNIELEGNCIGNAGVTELMDAFTHCPQLT